MPPKHKVGWWDEEHDNYGHGEWIDEEQAKKIKKALKSENPDLQVIIYPPVEDEPKRKK